MGIADDETRKLLNVCLNELAANGDLDEPSRGKFRMTQKSAFVTGTVDMTSSGAAFVVSEEFDGDIYITANNLHHALNGDLVKVFVYADRGHRHVEGEVVEIIKRKRELFVGIVETSKHFAFLVPERSQMPFDIFIPLDKMKGAQRGQKATARIVEWTDKQKR